MRRLVLVSLLVVVGCDSPHLAIAVDVPAPYGEMVEELRLNVLEPPEAGALTCDAVAFGERSMEALVALRTQQIVWRRDDGGNAPLDGIARTGHKILWVDAVSAEGVPLVAGCASMDEEIDGATQITIVAEPVVAATTPTFTELFNGELSGPPPAALPVTVTNALGAPVGGIEIRWRMVGPASEIHQGSVQSNGTGAATVVPGRLTVPGPYAISLRARWQATDPPPILGITPARSVVTVQGATERPVDQLVGPFLPDGRPGLAIMVGRIATAQPGAATAFLVDAALYVGGYNPVRGRFDLERLEVGAASSGLGLVRRGGRDRIVLIRNNTAGSAPRFSEVHLDAGMAPSLEDGPAITLPVPLAVGTFQPAGSCDPEADGATLLSVTWFDGAVQSWMHRTYNAAGVPAPGPFDQIPLSPTSSGCLEVAPGEQARTLLSFFPGSSLAVSYLDDGALVAVPLRAAIGGLRYLPPIGDESPALAAPVFSQQELALGVFQVRASPAAPDGFALERLREEPLILGLSDVVGGDTDGDGRRDLVGLHRIGTPGPNGEVTIRLLQVTGLFEAGRRISAATVPLVHYDPAIHMADFDGDGRDDIYIGNRLLTSDPAAGLPFSGRAFLMGHLAE